MILVNHGSNPWPLFTCHCRLMVRTKAFQAFNRGSTPRSGTLTANDPDYQRKYHKKHYTKNKQKYLDNASKRRKVLRLEVQKIKDVPCLDCGVKYPYWVMHFDHRNNDRNGNACVSRLISSTQRTKLYEEIDKCDIVCANCHADRTYKRMQATVIQGLE